MPSWADLNSFSPSTLQGERIEIILEDELAEVVVLLFGHILLGSQPVRLLRVDLLPLIHRYASLAVSPLPHPSPRCPLAACRPSLHPRQRQRQPPSSAT